MMNSVAATSMVNNILFSNAIQNSKGGDVANTPVNTVELVVVGVASLALVVCIAIVVVAYKKCFK